MHRQGPLQPGTVIGQRYEVVRLLRQEPYGDVALARDQLLETEVGIKVFPGDNPDFDAAFELYRQEAIWGMRLHSPQILGVHTLEEAAEGLVLVQESFAGTTLLQLIGKGEKLTIPDALYFIEVLAKGLAYAHKQGVVHHYFNPLNVLVSATEGVKIANFAFPPDGGEVSAEIRAYIPPEVVQGNRITPAGNIYALGVLGYRMLVGELPTPGASGHLEMEHIPPALKPVLSQCLEEARDRRFQSLTEFLVWLGRSRELLESDAEPLSLSPEPEKETAPAAAAVAEPPPARSRAEQTGREPEIQIIPDWLPAEEPYDKPHRGHFLADWQERGRQAWQWLRDRLGARAWQDFRWNKYTLAGLGAGVTVVLLLVIYLAWPRSTYLPIESVVKDRPLEESYSRAPQVPLEAVEKPGTPTAMLAASPEPPSSGTPAAPGAPTATGPAVTAPAPLPALPMVPATTEAGRPPAPPAATPTRAVKKPAKPAPARPAAKPAAPKKEQFGVLVGTYQKEADARKLADKVKQGKATVLKSVRGNKTYYQVWISPLPTKAKAESTAKAIKGSLGVTPRVVKLTGESAR